MPLERYEFKYSPSSYSLIEEQTGLFNLDTATSLKLRKLWIQNC